MSTAPPDVRAADAGLAAALLAIAPAAIGGIVVRARNGPVREAWLDLLKRLMPDAPRFSRLPLNVGDDRLIGGLDLAATLERGRPVVERGVLAAADGSLLIVPSAERLDGGRTARLGQALDRGEIDVERDGLSHRAPARFGLVALDEGIDEGERTPAALNDRLAIAVDLDGVGLRDIAGWTADADQIAAARARLASVEVPITFPSLFCQAADALGIASLRMPMFALRIARLSAALAGRDCADEEDAAAAARLVLAPRATRLPQAAEPDEPTPPDGDDAPPQQPESSDAASGETEPQPMPLDEDLELILAAVASALPADVLSALAAATRSGRAPESCGKAGVSRSASLRGRPAGVDRGAPRNGKVLNLIETLRTAAPWQTIRRRAQIGSHPASPRRVEIRADDFRVTRFKQKTQSTTIFVVDASGSNALHRLAEAKGAVEAILTECYVRRDQVALIAFRGTDAETLIPPTRSLTRAQRSLAALPGGGGTPLATALDSAAALAAAQKSKGITPTIVILTDGKANIGRQGKPGRANAMSEARTAAAAVRALGIATLLIDTSPRRNAEAQDIAGEMGARYLPLPHADGATLSKAVMAARSG